LVLKSLNLTITTRFKKAAHNRAASFSAYWLNGRDKNGKRGARHPIT
jgi:hypothetical protein